MADRAGRSLTASPEGIKLAKAARRNFPTSNQVLAENWGMCRSVLQNFFAGRPVGYENFLKICQELKLSWQEIADSQVCSSNPDPSFVGREEAIANLNTLVNQGAKVILIHAKGGVGKTTLARKYFQQHSGSYIEFPIAKETQNITSVESLIEERLKQLGEEPGREFGVSLDRLKRKLEAERIGVLIDNLEPALDGNGKIIEPHRRYVELLRVLANPEVQSVTLITSRECLHESAITVQHYPLEGLELGAWQEFFNNRNIQTDTSALSAMHEAYGGNAKAMEILSSTIFQDYEGNLEAYWQANQGDLLIERDLEDLVVCQFNRLQQFNSEAYKLLCRMGCYRYQDVPTVPEEGLFCLLWDVPESQHRRVVKSLRDRSLVEFRNGDYWLHPVIRAEAITRLRASEDWETGNRKAAEFWTQNVKKVETVEDAVSAFEAYYHYIEINDFDLACSVIIKERDDQWIEDTPLGVSFYTLGLLKQMSFAISYIISHLDLGYPLSVLYNILGDLYWLTGDIHKAIECHYKSGEIASNLLEKINQKIGVNTFHSRLLNLKVASLINIGLCQIDLWEIQKAVNSFETAIALAEKIKCDIRYKNTGYFCLALLNSYLGFKEKSLAFIEKVNSEAKHRKWGIGYRLLFLGLTYKNLGEHESSLKMYHRALKFAEKTHYNQVRAKALMGLADLYRERKDFKTALSNYSEAIELLDKIAAKCDLAEAYYQLGLTYQKIGDKKKSQENFDKAIQLFSEMEAPKQVEKVRQAMESGG